MLLLGFATKFSPRLAAVSGYFIAAIGCTLPVYTVAAVKHVFQRGWWNTLFKVSILAVIYAMAIFATVLVVFIYSLMNL
jgi:hypothetical protein